VRFRSRVRRNDIAASKGGGGEDDDDKNDKNRFILHTKSHDTDATFTLTLMHNGEEN
jgi:hypothetical protein